MKNTIQVSGNKSEDI